MTEHQLHKLIAAIWLGFVFLTVAGFLIAVYLCAIRPWMGAPDCCCCGEKQTEAVIRELQRKGLIPDAVQLSDVPDITDPNAPHNGSSTITITGDGSAGRPFVLAGGNSPMGSTSDGNPTAVGFAGNSTTGTESGLEPVDITGPLSGSFDEVDTLIPWGDGGDIGGGGLTPCPPSVCGGGVSAAPEPSTWLDMVAGIALVGCTLRMARLARS